jgi:hypothetical protein
MSSQANAKLHHLIYKNKKRFSVNNLVFDIIIAVDRNNTHWTILLPIISDKHISDS